MESVVVVVVVVVVRESFSLHHMFEYTCRGKELDWIDLLKKGNKTTHVCYTPLDDPLPYPLGFKYISSSCFSCCFFFCVCVFFPVSVYSS